MSIATSAQKVTQANQMAASAKATDNPQVMSFSRFTSMVNAKACTQVSHPNGHITQANASLCAQARAEEFLASLPSDTTEEAALALLGEVQIFTIDRYMCLSAPVPADWTQGQALPQKCKFGHKTQAQASKCVGTQATTQARAASKVTVALGGSLASHLATQATQEATQEATQATTQEATQATPEASKGTQATPKATPKASKLHSGSQGQVARA
jgi:hypothetical protein